MDLKYKGITWVGNLCQKLEAMRVEVEHIVCEEAKNVESQVMTVGVSVKKMYEVVQDFLPPTSLDPVKEACSELSLVQDADIGTYKKSNVASDEDPIKEKTSHCKELLLIAPSEKDSSQTSFANGISNANPLLGTYKKSKIASDEDPIKEKTSPSKELVVIAPAEKDSSQTSFSNGVSNVNSLLGTYKKSKVACDKDRITEKTSPCKELGVIASAEKDSSQTLISNVGSNINSLHETYKKSKVAIDKNPIKEKTSPHKELGVIASAKKDSGQTSFSNEVINRNPLLRAHKKSKVASDEDSIKEKISHKETSAAEKDSSKTSMSNGVSSVNPLLENYKKSMVASDKDPIKEKTSPHKELGVIAPAEKDSGAASFSNAFSNVNPLHGTNKISKVASDEDPVKEKTSPGKETSSEKDSSQTSISNRVSNINPLLGIYKKSKAANGKDPIKEKTSHKALGVIALAEKDSCQTSFSNGVGNVNPLLGTHKRSKVASGEDPIKEKTTSHTELVVISLAEKDSAQTSLSNGDSSANSLLAPFSVDPVKGAGLDSSLEENTVVICKRSEVGTEEDPIKNKAPAPRLSEEIAPVVSRASLLSSFCDKNNVDPQSCVDSVIVVGSHLSLEQKDDSGNYKNSTEGIGDDPINEKPLAAEVAPAGSDSSSASSLNIIGNGNHENACNKLTKISPLPSVDNVSVATECISNISRSFSFSDCVDPVVPCENKVVKIKLAPSSSVLSTEYNAPMRSYTNRLEKDSASISPLEVGRLDDDNAELAECNNAIDPGKEMIEEFDNVKLGESCSVTDTKELIFISPRPSIRRSYRKKIQDAFASRMRSTKQREYEQLAIWHLDFDAEIHTERAEGSKGSTFTRDLDLKKVPPHDSCESDWELL